MAYRYVDRSQAGQELAQYLTAYAEAANLLVFGLPRGGVPIAYEVAHALRAPLDVFTVRKLGLPGHEELAMGAITTDGTYVIDNDLIEYAGISRQDFDAVIARESEELHRRERMFRGSLPEPALEEKTALVVDDGLATGSTMAVAIKSLRKRKPARILVAAPVGAAETCVALRQIADEVICPYSPQPFHAVGLYYLDFTQVSDAEVGSLLARGREESRQWNVA